MRRIVVALLLLFLAPHIPAQAEEDKIPLPVLDCGSMERNNTALPYGNGQSPWLEYNVESIRSMNAACIAQVYVSGRVQGVGSTSGEKYGAYAASLKKPIALPNWGEYTVESNHWFYHTTSWWDLGWRTSRIDIRASEDEPPPDESPDEEEGEPEESVSGHNPDSASPLILDLAHNGFHLTNVEGGVLFDIDGDGELDRVAWTKADSDDAWLALDRNGNGTIDDGTELFGNHTPALFGRSGTTPNGFEALAFTEGPTYGHTGNGDRVIDAQDAVFNRLLLWTDLNHNGISEPEELQSVGAGGVRGLSTNYKESRKRDAHGNLFTQRAKASFTDGEFFVYDVWLKRLQ